MQISVFKYTTSLCPSQCGKILKASIFFQKILCSNLTDVPHSTEEIFDI